LPELRRDDAVRAFLFPEMDFVAMWQCGKMPQTVFTKTNTRSFTLRE